MPEEPILKSTTAFINAGGLATRLQRAFGVNLPRGITKAMLSVGDPPIRLIDHHLNRLLGNGFRNVLVSAGHHDSVDRYVSNRYAGYPVVTITYPTQQGTGGDLLRSLNDHSGLFGPHVYICNVDTIVDVDDRSVLRSHLDGNASTTSVITTREEVPNHGAIYVAGY